MVKKGLAIIAVPFLFQVVFLAVLRKAQNDSAEAEQWAIHTKEVIAQTEAVSRLLNEAQSGVRGFTVSGDRAMARAFEDASRQLTKAVARLQSLVRDNPGQSRHAAELRVKIEAFLAKLAETKRLAATGQSKQAMVRVNGQLGDGLRVEIGRFLNEEERLDALRRERLRRSWRTQTWAMMAGGSASVLTAMVVVLAFHRGFARQVAALGENARRLAEGQVLAAPVGRGDELGRLDSLFHAMAASLAEKDRENEMFIFSVSHDLRSPLVNLQGFARELEMSCDDLRAELAAEGVPTRTRERVAGLLDRDMATSIQFIQTAVTRLSAIIDALLRLSRAGRVEYRWQAVDVSAAVARVVRALTSTAAQRRAEVVVVQELPPAWGDPTAVEQVFANLVGNALNYLDPSRPGRVEVGTLVENRPECPTRSSPITYYVKDNGQGIPAAYQDKIFLAFQRLHPDAAEGEGIGLALVKRVIERHGGKVWFESQVGVGSTFTFTLQAPPGPQSPAVPVQSVATFAGGKGSQLWPATH